MYDLVVQINREFKGDYKKKTSGVVVHWKVRYVIIIVFLCKNFPTSFKLIIVGSEKITIRIHQSVVSFIIDLRLKNLYIC